MNKTNRTLFLAAFTAIALWLSTFGATAQESKSNDQSKASLVPTALSTQLSDCVAYLKPEYVESIKPADFLEGNKLAGSFHGFEGDFAKFSRKDSKELIFIPISAVLYITGKQKFVSF